MGVSQGDATVSVPVKGDMRNVSPFRNYSVIRGDVSIGLVDMSNHCGDNGGGVGAGEVYSPEEQREGDPESAKDEEQVPGLKLTIESLYEGMEDKKMDWPKIWRVVKRLFRTASAVGIAAFLANLTDDERWLALAPVLNSLFKYLRETWKVDWVPKVPL